MTNKEIDQKIAELEADKLMSEAQIKSQIDLNESRAVMIYSLKRQKELNKVLETIQP
jgi:hypothetical protein